MKCFWMIVVVFIMVGITACGGGGPSGGSSLSADEHNVIYEVSSSTLDRYFMITYIDEDGITVKLPNIHVVNEPWRYSFIAKNGTHLYLYVKAEGDSLDRYYATIYVDSQIASTISETSGDTSIGFTIPAE
jgi:hypothetical protein